MTIPKIPYEYLLTLQIGSTIECRILANVLMKLIGHKVCWLGV